MRLELRQAGVRIDSRWPIRGASLTLRSGHLTTIVGPNGAGKTTLMRLLSGLRRLTEGEAFVDEQDLYSLTRRNLAKRIAFSPQDTHLSFAFKVRDVVLMGRHAHLGRFEREGERDYRAVAEAMERADVAGLAERVVTELSGGERQRVVIARSLATEADAIIMDEPTANLDVSHALDIMNLCRELASEGKIVVLSTHDLNLAARYSTEVVLVSAGRVVATGAAEEVLSEGRIWEVFGVCSERLTAPSGETIFLFHCRSDGSKRREVT
jgi:iron complex transport system ATP-binding protein